MAEVAWARVQKGSAEQAGHEIGKRNKYGAGTFDSRCLHVEIGGFVRLLHFDDHLLAHHQFIFSGCANHLDDVLPFAIRIGYATIRFASQGKIVL